MRLFVALDIDPEIRTRIARFIEAVGGFASGARWVTPESLHITLKFIGELPENLLEKAKEGLSRVEFSPVAVQFRGYGFFPTAKGARVFWIGIESGPELARLAGMVDDALSTLGIPREEHAFTAHLTLARGGGGSGSPQRRREDGPNQTFEILQKHLASIPQPGFGTMTAREFFLYQSQLSPRGAKYTKLERFSAR